MSLKNYSTTIAPERTIAEIEVNLSLHGATDIHKQYKDGNVIALTFGVQTEQGVLPFRLPVKPEAVRQILMEEKPKGISKKTASDITHARRVTWRILKDWIDAQIALIEVNMVKVEEVFMPYLIAPRTNKTLFQVFEQEGFKRLLTENSGED